MNQPSTREMKKRLIRPLPKQVINKIAAGEVVERPAAVVKELVENAIDSGADRIEIKIEKSGASLIQIVDNGCGIEPDQIEIAFSRHATSKIRGFDDLTDLSSYGFRGEALPSIASVSQLRMLSRSFELETGQEIIIEGGVLQSSKPAAAPIGTTVEIRSLFYNTPARRKFLKSENTEARHISRIATAMALGRSEIGFSYSLNGRQIFSLPPHQTMAERAASLLAPGERFLPVRLDHPLAEIRGFVGPPQTAQNTRQALYLFINNRFIQSATLAHGVQSGYGELLPPRKFPVGIVHIQVKPSEVDVNVHPTKIEVRLAAERDIHDLIHRAVKEGLKSDGIVPIFSRSQQSRASDMPDGSHPHSGSGRIPGLSSGEPANLAFYKQLYENANNYHSNRSETDDESRSERIDRDTGEIISSNSPQTQSDSEHPDLDRFRLVGRFANLYLLIQAGDDLYIVDQHTAHERVLYEDILAKVERQSINSQQLLFPVQIELEPTQFAVFVEALDLFNSSGFVVSEFGGRTVNIEAVPVVMSKKAPERMLMKVIDDFASLRRTGLDVKKAMAQSMACRAAVMSGDRLNDREAEGLLHSLLQCENRYSCPHGRPTFIKLSREDLDRQFGRA